MKKQVITALATPFLGGKLDVNSYLKLLEAQKAASCDVLVAGTTAEGALLTVRERKLLMSITREYMAAPRCGWGYPADLPSAQ